MQLLTLLSEHELSKRCRDQSPADSQVVGMAVPLTVTHIYYSVVTVN
jgi:hypothetical protein